ncbi:MAG: biopolymer transporter ExbD [Planctomycetes bacterium]|nr:biopolymer transporter ExbD [Planctomycetota bacterium]MCB9913130.1 biopolymer transporter ExbD [Planctomycetota bacterium]
MRHRQASSTQEDRMEMTPMIDVTFLLLIFFMCTLKFRVLEGKLTAFLPKDQGVLHMASIPLEKVQVDIHVVDPGQARNAQGTGPYVDPSGQSRRTYVGRILSYTIGTQRMSSLADLQARLAQIHAARPGENVPVVLQPFADTLLGDVVPVLDAALAAGFTQIAWGGAVDDTQR